MSTKSTAPVLNRVLGLTSGILLVIGIMIGSGVFKKIVPMSASGLSEANIIAAWVVAGIITMLGAFTISGLAGLTVESGGEYEYLRLIFGNFSAFIFGWSSFTIIGSASIAAIAVVFCSSVNELLPFYNPLDQWKTVTIGNNIHPFADSGIKIAAVATIALLTWLNYTGTKKAATLNNIVTWAKMLGILTLIFVGFLYSGKQVSIAENAKPVITGDGGATAFFAAMLSAFWAYDGWLNVSFITGEIKNPKRNVPISIITGISIVLILYVLVNIAFLKVLSLPYLASLGDNDIAAAAMLKETWGGAGTIFISVLILLSTFGAVNGMVITYSRMYYQMAKEGYFFKKAACVHQRYNTPHISLLYSMFMSCALVFSGSFDMLTDMIVFAGFLFYALLAVGLIKMKRRGVITQKLPGYPFTAILFIVASGALLINTILTQPQQTLIGVILMFSGVPFYFMFKKQQANK